MENEFEPLRGALGKRMKRTAPADLAGKVMEEVQRLERRRVYRRLVLVLTLRSAVFVVVLLLLLLPLISQGIRVDAAWKTVQGLKHGGEQALNSLYFVTPLIVLLLVRRIFAIK